MGQSVYQRREIITEEQREIFDLFFCRPPPWCRLGIL